MSFLSGLVDAGKDKMMEHAVDQAADAAKDKVLGIFGVERKKKEKESGGIGGLLHFGDKKKKEEESGGLGGLLHLGDKDKKKKEAEKKGSGGGVIGGFLSFLDGDKKVEKTGGFNGLFSEPPPSRGEGSDGLDLDDALGNMATETAVEEAT